MLRIWVDSLPPSVDAVQELTESLIAINKEKLAGISTNQFILSSFVRRIKETLILCRFIEIVIRKMQEPDNPRQKTKHCCDKECIVM